MNVIFAQDLISVQESFYGISLLNCTIYALVYGTKLGFPYFKSVHRFWLCKPSYV